MDFKINMIYDDCTLRVTDDSDYKDKKKHSLIDFIIYNNGILEDSIRITSPIVSNIYRYTPEEDGRYIFNRIKLPNINKYITGYLSEHDERKVVKIPANEYFEWNGDIYIYLAIPGVSQYLYPKSQENRKWSTDEEIAALRENTTEVCNCIEALTRVDIEDLDENLLGYNWFQKEFFSICSLNTCVANAQKKWLLKHIDECGNKCQKSDADASQRDFLFITSYVLDYLISIGDYDQAEDILNNIKTSCNNICNDGKGKGPNSCGCNGR